MPSFLCIAYPRFLISGTTLGLYTFELNPSSADLYPQRTTKSYSTIMSVDPTNDQTYTKIECQLNWGYMPYTMYTGLLPYTKKNVDGTSNSTYFWDTAMGRFNGTRITVTNFKGEAVGGNTGTPSGVDRYNVQMTLRQIV